MKTNLLKMRRVLSATLLVLLLNVVGMTNAFAQTQVATLQHNDTISMYYGPNSFVQAHSAAANGDIITLSSGTFNKCPIAKAVTVRGAGCVYDDLTNVMPTIISGDFNLGYSNVTFEGILFTGEITSVYSAGGYYSADNVRFIKCNISTISNTSSWVRGNYQFINCLINNCYFRSYHDVLIVNSVIQFKDYYHTDINYPSNIYNSLLVFNTALTINNIMAYNSIIVTNSGHTVSNCSFFNCVGLETGSTLLFENQLATNVIEVNNYSDVFETFNGTVSFDENYNLKNDIIDTFLGNDGTQVGIYGGMMPYNPRPTYMKIKRCNVASRSTIDGKLSVDIEIINEDN